MLPGHHLGAQRLELRPSGGEDGLRARRAGGHLLRPAQREVAEHDRDRHAEILRGAREPCGLVIVLRLHVLGGTSAAHGGVVDDVVVKERRGLHQLDRRPHAREGVDLLRRRLAPERRHPAPEAETRAQQLPAPEEGREIVHENGALRGDPRQLCTAFGELLGDDRRDPRDQQRVELVETVGPRHRRVSGHGTVLSPACRDPPMPA